MSSFLQIHLPPHLRSGSAGCARAYSASLLQAAAALYGADAARLLGEKGRPNGDKTNRE